MIDFYNYKEEKYELIPEPAEMLQTSKAELDQTLKRFQFSTLGWLRSALAGIAFCITLSLSVNENSLYSFYDLALDMLMGAIIGPVIYAYLFSVLRVVCLKKLRKIRLQMANGAQDELLFSQRELIADHILKIALVISGAGAIAVTAGITMLVYLETEHAYLTISAGIVSQCLAAVFFNSYSRLITKTTAYQHKPYHLNFDS